MIIPSNLKVRFKLFIILYVGDLLIVNSYLSGKFLSYIDIDGLILKPKYYFDVFCHILALVSVNYIVISFYAKITYSYKNSYLNEFMIKYITQNNKL